MFILSIKPGHVRYYRFTDTNVLSQHHIPYLTHDIERWLDVCLGLTRMIDSGHVTIIIIKIQTIIN